MAKTRRLIILRPNQHNNGDLRLALFAEDYQKRVQGNVVNALFINFGTTDCQIDSLTTYCNHGSVKTNSISTWLQQSGFHDESDLLLFELEINNDEHMHKYRYICRTGRRLNEKEWFIVRMALDASISASVRRNPLFVNRNESDRMRRKWKELLLKYSYDVSANTFADTVHQLQTELIVFAGNAAMVRLSHAQKSLSLFLKYLWCNGLAPLPPACPIDRAILHIARQHDNTIETHNWTLLDDIEDYRRIITALGIWAGQATLAEKELEYWNNL